MSDQKAEPETSNGFGPTDCYPSVYCDGADRPLDEALQLLTDEFIEDGICSRQ